MVSKQLNSLAYVLKALQIHNPEIQFFIDPSGEKNIIFASSPSEHMMKDIWMPEAWMADIQDTSITIPIEDGSFITIIKWNEMVYEGNTEGTMTSNNGEIDSTGNNPLDDVPLNSCDSPIESGY